MDPNLQEHLADPYRQPYLVCALPISAAISSAFSDTVISWQAQPAEEFFVVSYTKKSTKQHRQ